MTRLSGPKRDLRPWYLLLPAVALYAVFFFIPLLIMIVTSVETFNGVEALNTFTVSNYVQFFTESVFQNALFQTLLLGFAVTVTALALGFPTAYVISRAKRNVVKTGISVIIILPLFVSLVARTFGWIIVLSNKGLINYVLESTGLATQPTRLIFNFTGVFISMVHVLMQFMVLSIDGSLTAIDENLLSSARSLGASTYQVFRRIVLPLSLPGIAAGSIITFILTISAYVTPALLGGGSVPSLPVSIYNYAVLYLNTPLASALAVVLLIIATAMVSIYLRLLRAERSFGGGSR